MTLQDFASRFEEQLNARGARYTLRTETDDTSAVWKYEHKHFEIADRVSCFCPVLVSLTKCRRLDQPHRRGRTICKAFAVKDGKIVKGGRNVWAAIQSHCLPV